ncbi:protein kinase [Yinghuangia aomiensis]
MSGARTPSSGRPSSGPHGARPRCCGSFRHPGVVQLKTYDPAGHSAGPALVFDYHPQTLRLHEYLVQYGEKLDVLSRIALVRQLAETMRSAHGRRLYHRTLAARAIHVIPRGRTGSSGSELAGWLNPHVQISDWQIAVERGSDSATPGGGERFAPTTFSQAGAHLAEGADAYLAPELTATKADPVALDVYGLGVLTYLLVTGEAPAASQAALMARFEAGEGLLPSGVVDGLSPDIDDLVQAATAYNPKLRLRFGRRILGDAGARRGDLDRAGGSRLGRDARSGAAGREGSPGRGGRRRARRAVGGTAPARHGFDEPGVPGPRPDRRS